MQKNSIIAIVIVAVVVIAGAGAALLLTNNGKSNTAKTDDRAASFHVTSFSVNKHNVLDNQSARVSIDVVNNGTKDGNYTANLTMDGSLYQSQTVHLDINETKTLNFTVTTSEDGNHTMAIGDNSTYLHFYPEYVVGAYMKVHVTGSVNGILIDYGANASVVSLTATTYTETITYLNINYPSETITYNMSAPWSEGLTNLTYIGNETVQTHWGNMTLSHYRVINGTETIDRYLYVDGDKGWTYKEIDSDTYYTLTTEIIDTNMPWMPELPIQ
ncbi:MAG: hypothetical protein SA339_10290 [Methanomassiliicoccus sp.]|nr:hypothetical protein [Methanomassiliicoccus sp.]